MNLNEVYGAQKVEGGLSLRRNQIVVEEEICSGDRVDIFAIPDGRYLLTKDKEGVLIEKMTSAFVLFETEINVETK